MNKICTNIDQSKKLIELGIDPKTADMIYYWFGNFELNDEWYELHLGTNRVNDKDILAWSLSALLGLMSTNNKKDKYYVDTESHSDYHIVSYRNCWDGCIHSEYSEESLLDAVFEMVCWLLKNKKLCG